MISLVVKPGLPDYEAPKKDSMAGKHYDPEIRFTMNLKSDALCDSALC